MSGVTLTCWRDAGDPKHTLLKQFLTEQEYESLSHEYQDFYDSVTYTDENKTTHLFFVFKHADFERFKKFECRVEAPPQPDPPPPPEPPPPPDPPYQPSNPGDWDDTLWYKDTTSGLMFPFKISYDQYNYEYSKHTARYESAGYGGISVDPIFKWYELDLESRKYHYDNVPAPMYGSLGASESPPPQDGPQNSAEAVEGSEKAASDVVPTATTSRVKKNVYYKAPKSPLVLPRLLDRFEFSGAYKAYQGYYTKTGYGGALGNLERWVLDEQRIKNEGFVVIVDVTSSPSAADRERDGRSWSGSAGAAAWSSVVEEVFAARARDDAQRRAAGAAACGERRL
jgi:hypothetical protein